MLSRAILASSLLGLASAHFQLTWPASRGFDDEKTVNFPCGGFETPSAERQPIPLTGSFPIQLSMEHTGVRGMVVLALGNEPTGDDYTIVLRQPFQETGPENFCIGDVTLPVGLNITEGTNATIQVVTNGDPNGGLYQCGDITFTSTALSQNDYNSHCTNSTGVTATYISDSSTLPNGTSATGGASSSGSASASASASGSGTAASATSSAGGARQTVGAILLGAAGVLGMAAL